MPFTISFEFNSLRTLLLSSALFTELNSFAFYSLRTLLPKTGGGGVQALGLRIWASEPVYTPSAMPQEGDPFSIFHFLFSLFCLFVSRGSSPCYARIPASWNKRDILSGPPCAAWPGRKSRSTCWWLSGRSWLVAVSPRTPVHARGAKAAWTSPWTSRNGKVSWIA